MISIVWNNGCIIRVHSAGDRRKFRRDPRPLKTMEDKRPSGLEHHHESDTLVSSAFCILEGVIKIIIYHVINANNHHRVRGKRGT